MYYQGFPRDLELLKIPFSGTIPLQIKWQKENMARFLFFVLVKF